MEQWIIEGTDHTPMVKLDGIEALLTIKGRSYPEEGMEFWEPILHRSEIFSTSKRPLTTLHIKLEYYNSSTMKALSILISHLKVVEKGGKNVKVIWEYEIDDEGIQEDIEVLREAHDITIEERETHF